MECRKLPVQPFYGARSRVDGTPIPTEERPYSTPQHNGRELLRKVLFEWINKGFLIPKGYWEIAQDVLKAKSLDGRDVKVPRPGRQGKNLTPLEED